MVMIPHYVTLNVFGFSRGAAAARNFVHLANTQPELFKNAELDKDWNFAKNNPSKQNGVSVNFVGLFDTVASYGKDLNFSNDTEQLHLNFDSGYANKVVHLVALDEYRANFPLTNINSALGLSARNGKGKMGYELRIPVGALRCRWWLSVVDRTAQFSLLRSGAGRKSHLNLFTAKVGTLRHNTKAEVGLHVESTHSFIKSHWALCWIKYANTHN